MKRKLTAALCALCLTLGLALPALAAEVSFPDVSESDWFYADVQNMVDRGLMGGVAGDRFSPYGEVTRGTVVTLLWRLEGSPDAGSESGFSDVDPAIWYAPAVAWAAAEGVADGYDNGTFQPEAAVTRETLAVFLYKYESYKGHELAEGMLELYADGGEVSGWAEDAMRHCVGAGLFAGSDGKLNPSRITTRCELAATVSRMLRPVAG